MGNYFDRAWYEKNLMEYFDFCEYNEMANDPTKYFKKKQVVNFDIIHHECCGGPLFGSYRDYKTAYEKDIKEYPKPEKKEVVGGIFRNSNRKDIWVEKKVIVDHFKG